MAELPVEQKAAQAIRHVLNYIHESPEVGWYLGLGTESFALLTEADAALRGQDLKQTREQFRPRNPVNPREARGETEDIVVGSSLLDPCFIRAMQYELVRNQNKGDWNQWRPDRLDCIHEIFHHARKVLRALQQNDTDRVKEHSADLANIAMKTAEIHGKVES